MDFGNLAGILDKIRTQIRDENLRLTQHAQKEMVEEHISTGDVLEAIAAAQILEYYGRHRRGACCMLHGITVAGRAIHVVCTTDRPILIIITVYERQLSSLINTTLISDI